MIKGILFTLGSLVAVGGATTAGLMVLAALSNPAPSASSDHATTFSIAVGVTFVGIAMSVGACFL